MKKILLVLCLVVLSSCSLFQKAKYCSPKKAVELLLNNQPPPFYKVKRHYQIDTVVEKYVYFGKWKPVFLKGCKMKPYYKTDKKEFYEIYDKVSSVRLSKLDSLVDERLSRKYSHFLNDSVKGWARSEIKLSKNKDKYDIFCEGVFELYYNKMEKSKEPDIDSVYNHYTVKKFNYEALFTNDKELKWVKTKEVEVTE